MREGEQRARRHAKRLRRTMTDAEVILWSLLRRNQMQGLRLRRQHPIGPYIADFACIPANLVVEVDGATHATPEECAHDLTRTAFLVQQGWRVVRVNNEDVYRNLDGVLRTIETSLSKVSSDD